MAATRDPITLKFPNAGVRAASVTPVTFDASSGEIDVVWFTDPDAVLRDDLGQAFIERLHPEGCDLSRINAGGPFCWNHPWMARALGTLAIEPEDIIGNAVPGSVTLTPSAPGAARIRLIPFPDRPVADTPDDQQAAFKVAHGFVRGISPGYTRDVVRIEVPKDGLPILHVDRWTVTELSAAPIQEDAGAATRNLEVSMSTAAAPTTDPTRTAPATETPAATTSTGLPAQGATTSTGVPDGARAMDATSLRLEGAKAERDRIDQIRAACRALRLPDEVADQHVRSGADIHAVRAALITAKAAEGDRTHTDVTQRVRVTRDEGDTLREAVIEGVSARAGGFAPAKEPARRFAARTLLDTARIYLREACSVPSEDLDEETLIHAAFGGRALPGAAAPSDLPNLLVESGQRNLARGYQAEARDFGDLVRFEQVRDFRPVADLQFAALGGLEKMPVGGNPEIGTFTEAKETYRVWPWGRGWRVTRTALINDDLGAFGRLPIEAGKIIRRAELDEFWTTFQAGKLADGKTVFHGDHKNVTASAGGVPSVEQIAAGVTLMAAQTDLSGSVLNLTPDILIVPKILWAKGAQITGKISPVAVGEVVPQIIGGLGLVSQGRLDQTSAKLWYLACKAYPCFVFATLRSAPEPRYRTEWDFDSEGLKVVINYDFGVYPVDYRGVYRNKGEA